MNRSNECVRGGANRSNHCVARIIPTRDRHVRLIVSNTSIPPGRSTSAHSSSTAVRSSTFSSASVIHTVLNNQSPNGTTSARACTYAALGSGFRSANVDAPLRATAPTNPTPPSIPPPARTPPSSATSSSPKPAHANPTIPRWRRKPECLQTGALYCSVCAPAGSLSPQAWRNKRAGVSSPRETPAPALGDPTRHRLARCTSRCRLHSSWKSP